MRKHAELTGVLGFLSVSAQGAYIESIIKAMPEWAFEESR